MLHNIRESHSFFTVHHKNMFEEILQVRNLFLEPILLGEGSGQTECWISASSLYFCFHVVALVNNWIPLKGYSASLHICSRVPGARSEKSTNKSARSPGASVREECCTGRRRKPPSVPIWKNGRAEPTTVFNLSNCLKEIWKKREFAPFNMRSRYR